MSMRSSIANGYGFTVSEIDGLQLLHFIDNHRDAVLRIWNTAGQTLLEELDKVNIDDVVLKGEDIDTMDSEKYEDLYDALGNITDYEFFECEGMDIIARIMGNETGVTFSFERAQEDCIGYPSILFETAYPWYFNEFEKTLTADKIDEILTPYVEELDIDTSDVNSYGYLEVEYYG